jgi:hypothetical protein
VFVRFLCNWPPYRDGQCLEIPDRIAADFVARCMAEVVTAAGVWRPARDQRRSMAPRVRAKRAAPLSLPSRRSYNSRLKMSTFVEFVKPSVPFFVGEIAGFDAATAAALIASGVAVSSSAPSASTPPSPVLVRFVGPVKVGAAIYENGEEAEAGFPAALANSLVAQGSATLV